MNHAENIKQQINALVQEGINCLDTNNQLESLAFLNGAVCEFGSVAAEYPMLRQTMIKAREGLGLRLSVEKSPLPNKTHTKKNCSLCNADMQFTERSLEKDWYCCPKCNLLRYFPDPEEVSRLEKGEPNGANAPPDSIVHLREAYFCDLFLDVFNWETALLYGIGWSLVPKWLDNRGVKAVGCDLWQPLIERRRASWGPASFYHRDDLPDESFPLITAFEVFEHFLDPISDVGLIVNHLAPEGVIVGCTDFWHGGSITEHPSHDGTYWKHRTHVTAWSFDSMRYLAKVFNLSISFFKVDTAGFAAKVFFMLHRGNAVSAFVNNLPKVFKNAF